jgi:hypothetical protein
MRNLWGWTCEATWVGINDAIKITLPTDIPIAIKAVRYCDKFKQIEIVGHILPIKNIHMEYNDFRRSQSTSDVGRPSGNGGTDGETQPGKSQASNEQLF